MSKSTSDRQIAANQANAQLSTGPQSETGKSKSCLNAVKTGLTGHTVLLPSDDAALYAVHLAQIVKRYAPAGEEEEGLVQSLADTEWRLQRIPGLETGIYALGRLELAELFVNEPEDVRKRLLDSKILLTYQRQLNNLSIQENRLRRMREKDLARLLELQETRRRQTQERLDAAARKYIVAVHDDTYRDFDLSRFGFEFSEAQIELRAMDLDPKLFAEYEQDLRDKAA